MKTSNKNLTEKELNTIKHLCKNSNAHSEALRLMVSYIEDLTNTIIYLQNEVNELKKSSKSGLGDVFS